MSNESSTSYQFELLDSQNWFSWKTKMEAYLEEHDLEDVAKDGPTAAIPGTPTAVEAKAIADWKKKDAKARSRTQSRHQRWYMSEVPRLPKPCGSSSDPLKKVVGT